MVAAATAALAVGMDRVGVPSAALFAALVVGLVAALTGWPRPRRRAGAAARLQLPGPVALGAQAVLGVLSGALLQPVTLAELAGAWAPVLAAVVATLAISVLAGLLLGLRRDVDAATGSFAMVAGGASGLTSIAGELGADQRVVAVVQYLRVLVILLAMPVVALLLGSGSGGSGGAAGQPSGGLTTGAAPAWLDVAFTAVVGVVGVVLARRLRVPAGALLGPMVLAAAVSATGLTQGATVPAAVLQVAFALIGLQVGLSFTRESLRSVRRLLPTALGLIVLVIVATAAAGVPLLRLAGASTLDAYLATTPGGLYAVVATSADAGGDTTLVLAVQVLRLLVMLLLAPLIASALGRRGRQGPGGRGRRST